MCLACIRFAHISIPFNSIRRWSSVYCWMNNNSVDRLFLFPPFMTFLSLLDGTSNSFEWFLPHFSRFLIEKRTTFEAHYRHEYVWLCMHRRHWLSSELFKFYFVTSSLYYYHALPHIIIDSQLQLIHHGLTFLRQSGIYREK